VVGALQQSIAKWSAACGVQFAYDGPTTVPPNAPGGPDRMNVFGWGDVGALLPGASGVTIEYFITEEGGGGSLYDGDIMLDNRGGVPGQVALDTVAVHEIGHVLGLDHSDRSGAVMSGPPDSAYNGLARVTIDDIRGCRCLYGPGPGIGVGYSCSLPKALQFGRVPVGTPSVPQSFTVFNDGNQGLAIARLAVASLEVQLTGGNCTAGMVLPAGGRCEVQLVATPNAVGSRVAVVSMATSDGDYDMPMTFTGTADTAATIDAVEYYNHALDHYFVSWVGAEIAILDAGQKSRGWRRTGEVIATYPAAQAGASPLCRYYIPPDKGNSHFYGRGTTECTLTGQRNPTFVLEDPAFMHMVLPDAGACPAGTRPVYRVFSNRADANHRYTTSAAIRDEMVASGWLAEGDGPDRVVMCAPA
jgi:hypothetical protein